jgi:hypothetical protein
VRLQVLTAAGMNMSAVWDVAVCNIVEINRRFRGAYWHDKQGEHGDLFKNLRSAMNEISCTFKPLPISLFLLML